ncbi:RHS repeat-associated core domain-containing protein [Humisphaera borealis]|uniref:RHS repeat-associated core domain-containing protein n=1 Tax=Humisphaera borealis TaxID=2807512 RepID=A0A7M2X362_9BACT|nr:RHS repeat-associated core domain-containing protein [Humisphaera borealis]QOV92115.1 RHS repeat-associated core domain-containing protein [Humisphaera borealis]
MLGRSLTDAVTTLGSGVNGVVRRLQTSYNTQGLPEKFTSYDAASSGSVINEVQRAYNGLGQIITEYQAHSGAVNTGSSPKVQYAYTEMVSGANHSRLKSMTYPNGRVLRYEYSSGINADTSRISFLADDSSGSVGTHLEEYSYLGSGTIVRKNRPEPGVELTYIKQGAEPVADAGDQYTGLDHFGRIADQRWLVTSGGSHTDRWTYAYDRNSNPLYKKNELQSTMSELYHANSGSSGDNNTAYDKLNRLTDFRRGTLSSSANNGSGLDTVSSASRTQGWSLDALGNSTSVSTNGTPASRTHNSKNQSTVVGGNNLAFDSAGNTTTDDSGKQHVYDAWNRLVSTIGDAYNEPTVVSKYDALGRRIVSTNTTFPAEEQTVVDVGDLYYSTAWQVVEERNTITDTTLANSENPEIVVTLANTSQNVWGINYIDDLVLRDKDADNSSGTGSLGKSGSGLEQRLYAQQDANHNVTALVNTSGTVQQRFVYDPYGVATVLDASWSGTTDGYNWHYRHQGTRWEFNAELYDVRNRFYSPTLMRWMQEDPAGYVDGASLLQYVGGNPIAFVDPWGLQAGVAVPSAGSGAGVNPSSQTGNVAARAAGRGVGMFQITMELMEAGAFNSTVGYEFQMAQRLGASGLCIDSQREVWAAWQKSMEAGRAHDSAVIDAALNWRSIPAPAPGVMLITPGTPAAGNQFGTLVAQTTARDASRAAAAQRAACAAAAQADRDAAEQAMFDRWSDNYVARLRRMQAANNVIASSTEGSSSTGASAGASAGSGASGGNPSTQPTPKGSAALDQLTSIAKSQKRLFQGDEEVPRIIDQITKSERRVKNQLDRPYAPDDWE